MAKKTQSLLIGKTVDMVSLVDVGFGELAVCLVFKDGTEAVLFQEPEGNPGGCRHVHGPKEEIEYVCEEAMRPRPRGMPLQQTIDAANRRETKGWINPRGKR